MRQYYRDRYGSTLGYTEESCNRTIVYDRYGSRLGYYDGKYTYDRYGSKVGEGNLLAMLLR